MVRVGRGRGGVGGVNVPALTHWPPPVAPFDQEDHFVVGGLLALACVSLTTSWVYVMLYKHLQGRFWPVFP